jgi:hypothetical protein
VTPFQRHSGEATAIGRHSAQIYGQARQRNPRRWSRKNRCWHQAQVDWINPQLEETDVPAVTLLMEA